MRKVAVKRKVVCGKSHAVRVKPGPYVDAVAARLDTLVLRIILK